jgi:hypothetical protein
MAKPTPEETRSLSLDLETLGGMESSMVYTVQYRALSYKVWRRLYPVYIYDGCITRVHTRRLHLGYMQGKNDILFLFLTLPTQRFYYDKKRAAQDWPYVPIYASKFLCGFDHTWDLFGSAFF